MKMYRNTSEQHLKNQTGKIFNPNLNLQPLHIQSFGKNINHPTFKNRTISNLINLKSEQEIFSEPKQQENKYASLSNKKFKTEGVSPSKKYKPIHTIFQDTLKT